MSIKVVVEYNMKQKVNWAAIVQVIQGCKFNLSPITREKPQGWIIVSVFPLSNVPWLYSTFSNLSTLWQN